MNVLGHDAATSHAFDTFDERKAAVKKVFCATRCLLFGTWFSAYSLLARHDKWKETYPALVLLCPEGLLTRVTSEHERTFFNGDVVTQGAQDVTSAITSMIRENGDASEVRQHSNGPAIAHEYAAPIVGHQRQATKDTGALSPDAASSSGIKPSRRGIAQSSRLYPAEIETIASRRQQFIQSQQQRQLPIDLVQAYLSSGGATELHPDFVGWQNISRGVLAIREDVSAMRMLRPPVFADAQALQQDAIGMLGGARPTKRTRIDDEPVDHSDTYSSPASKVQRLSRQPFFPRLPSAAEQAQVFVGVESNEAFARGLQAELNGKK